MRVELCNVYKSYDETPTVKQLNLSIADGELVTILGPSGCGKSTTLLMIAGIYPVSSGEIEFDGKPMNGIAPKDRNIGMVFQNAALYPNMNVQQNIAFPLKNKGIAKKQRLAQAAEAAVQVQMAEYLTRKPNQLSGGQQQRVAIARAIVKMPGLLLLDEPLSSLDANLRISMREEIRRLQKETGITTVMVTHDQEEALTMSDKIAVMHGGVLQQFGTPEQLYNAPSNWFVARFLGMPVLNEIQCQWETTGSSVRLTETGQIIMLPVSDGREIGFIEREQRLRWAFRPHQMRIFTEKPEQQEAYLTGRVTLTEFTGREKMVHIKVGQSVVRGYAASNQIIREGENVWFKVSGNCYLFDMESGQSLYHEHKWQDQAESRNMQRAY